MAAADQALAVAKRARRVGSEAMRANPCGVDDLMHTAKAPGAEAQPNPADNEMTKNPCMARVRHWLDHLGLITSPELSPI